MVEERLWGRGRESGAEAEMRLFSIYRFDGDGLVTMRSAFISAEDALGQL